jgi:transcriptional regulator with XRE-family HTH domain
MAAKGSPSRRNRGASRPKADENIEQTSGAARVITDRWKAAVERRLGQLKMTRADLARAVGISKAGMSQLLTTVRASNLVEPINKALGWVPNESACYQDEAEVFDWKVLPGEPSRTAPWTRTERWEYLHKKFKTDAFADPEEVTPILTDLTQREAVELLEHLHTQLKVEQERADEIARAEETLRRQLEEMKFQRARAERAVQSRRRALDAIAEITKALEPGDRRWFY